MIRNLKVLGLALVAVFALSAMAASAASAQTNGSITSTGPWTGIGEETGVNKFEAFGSRVECTGSKITFHKTLKTSETEPPLSKTHEDLIGDEESATLTLDVNQSTCLADGEHKATVTLNGCDLDLMVQGTVETGKYNTAISQVCPTNKDIEIEVYAFKGSELGGVVCKITIKEEAANNNRTGATLANSSGTLVAGGTVQNISASRSGAGCATESTTEAKLFVNAKVKGVNAEGNETELSITHL